jgi:cytochrome c peroxidase
MSNVIKWIGRILIGVILLFLAIFLVAAVMPVAADPIVGENHGAGASSVEPSTTGLQREFPATNEPADNPSSEPKVELGYLLFFDSILSENNDISCASCHHPD